MRKRVKVWHVKEEFVEMRISVCIMSRVVPDSGSRKSGIWLFFGNSTKSGSGQISSRIWQMPV